MDAPGYFDLLFISIKTACKLTMRGPDTAQCLVGGCSVNDMSKCPFWIMHYPALKGALKPLSSLLSSLRAA